MLQNDMKKDQLTDK